MVYTTYLDRTLEVFGASTSKRVVYDDNIIDRLNHYYTNMILFILIVVVGTPELVGEYIECWCPDEFEHDQVQYVNYLCWVHNTYFIPMTKPIPVSYEMRYSNKIYYYQWTPLIFFVMAALFKIPRFVWKYISNRCGFGIKKMMTVAKDTQAELLYSLRRAHQINLFNAGAPNMEQTEFFPPGVEIEAERQKVLKFLARYMHEWCKNDEIEHAGLFCNSRNRAYELFDFGVGRRHGNFLITLLIVVRFLYLINIAGQLLLLNEFLADDFYIYGYNVIRDFLAGKDWSHNMARFPRVTLCDFDLRQLSNVRRYTLQCVLPINLYNEKIFIFLWFWFTFILVITFLNFVFTLLTACYNKTRENFVLKYLKLNDINPESDPKLSKAVKVFIYKHLKFDGIFILQLMSNNDGSAITMDVVRHLWNEFYDDYRKEIQSNRSSYVSNPSHFSSSHNSILTHRNSHGSLQHSNSKLRDLQSYHSGLRQNSRDSFVSLDSRGSRGTLVSTEMKNSMRSVSNL